LVICAALVVSGCQTTTQSAPPEEVGPARELTEREIKVISGGLAVDLKDPASVSFWWSWIKPPVDPNGAVTYCAALNARNSFGGYIGRSPFIAVVGFKNGVASSAYLSGIASDNTSKSQAVLIMCERAGYQPLALR
jgi:hypothetical protein